VGCNPMANVIIPTTFYVQDLGKLEDDNNYLKSCLWPLLEGFFASEDIAQFWSYYLRSFLESNTAMAKVYELQGQSRIVDFVEGEGTSEPSGSATEVSPHLFVHFVTNLLCCLYKKTRGRERRGAKHRKGARESVRGGPLKRYDGSSPYNATYIMTPLPHCSLIMKSLKFVNGLEFFMGQAMWLMNPRATRQKVAGGRISEIGREDKFHFISILETWFKIDVGEIFILDVPFMWENESADQMKVEDVKGGNAVWDQKFLKVEIE
jgi:hypothetical protein